MIALLEFAKDVRQENPYAAPQTREMTLPLAIERAELQPTRPDQVLPRSTQRWLHAALMVYVAAFMVPMWKSSNDWMPFAGTFFFFVGAMSCWHPLMFSWWANVFFVLARRNMKRGRSQRACVYAGLGVLAAASFPLIGVLDSNPNWFLGLTLNGPYLCWLAAMIVQWIAAVDLWQYYRNPNVVIHMREHV